MHLVALGKSSLRLTAQALAREFGPQAVHVAFLIVDGGIVTPESKEKDAKEDKVDDKMEPTAIADTYWWLHTQSGSSFTFEVDMRAFGESW